MPFYAGRFGYPIEGGDQIYFDASDYEAAEEGLRDLAGYIDAVEPPMRAAKAIAINEMKERFDTETDPSGREWTDLDPKYAKEKQRAVGFVYPILTEEGDLRRRATSESSWSISGESLFFDTSRLPGYWRVHEQGSDKFNEFWSHHVNPDPKAPMRQEGNVPPRPFIGLSKEASTKIFEVFDTWFEHGIDTARKRMAVSSRGTLQTRTAKGQFGPKL